jgi:hypothetical protein
MKTEDRNKLDGILRLIADAETIPVERKVVTIKKIGTSRGILALSVDIFDCRHIVKVDADTCDVINPSDICEETTVFRLTDSGYRLDFAARHKLQIGPIVEVL